MTRSCATWAVRALTLATLSSAFATFALAAGAQAPGSAQARQQPAQTGDPSRRTAVTHKGPATAPITIIEFSDFECPFCAQAQPALDEILAAYPDQIRLVFKHNPLPFHPHAPLAHEAALAAGAQGKFWEMHDLLFTNQQRLTRDDLLRYAQQLDLDLIAFAEALDGGVYTSAVELDRVEAQGLGVTGTPTFFISGRRLVAARNRSRYSSKWLKRSSVREVRTSLRGPATAAARSTRRHQVT